MKKIILIALSIILLFALIGCDKKTGEGNTKVGYEIGDLAYNIEVENFDGEAVKLSELRGKTVYILAWTST